MYREVTYSEELLKYWQDECNSADWYRESLETADTTEETFEAFCHRHRIFEIDGVALVYLEYVTPVVVNIHFSMLRGKHIELQNLIDIRNQLFDEGIEWIFGWVAKKNRWLRRVCEIVGMNFYGITDETKVVKGKPFPLWRYSMHITEFIIVENP